MLFSDSIFLKILSVSFLHKIVKNSIQDHLLYYLFTFHQIIYTRMFFDYNIFKNKWEILWEILEI